MWGFSVVIPFFETSIQALLEVVLFVTFQIEALLSCATCLLFMYRLCICPFTVAVLENALGVLLHIIVSGSKQLTAIKITEVLCTGIIFLSIQKNIASEGILNQVNTCSNLHHGQLLSP